MRTVQICTFYFQIGLQANFTEPPGAPDLPRFHLVDMYLSCTEQVVEEEIIRSFTQESNLRVVVATVAFGMGVNCAGIRQVIHFDTPSDLESMCRKLAVLVVMVYLP